MCAIAVARKRFPLIEGGAPRPTIADAKFWDDVVRQLEACAGFRNPQFDPQHIDALVHWLQHYERRPWAKVADDLWWQCLQEARINKAACSRVITLLQQAKGRDGKVALVVVGEILLGLETDIEWLEVNLGGGDKPRRAWAIMARMLGHLTLTALRGAEQLAGRKPRRSVGKISSPVVKFLYQRSARLAEQSGEKLPGLKTFYDVLINKL